MGANRSPREVLAPLVLKERVSLRRPVAGVVAGAAALAVLALVVLVASSSAAGTRSDLLDDISDADAAKLGAGDNGANWDQGWLNKFAKGDGKAVEPARDGERASRGRVGEPREDKAEEIDQIHSLLNKAVTMMGDLDHAKQDNLPEAAAAPGFELNRESKERLDKYEQFKKQSELPACFKLNEFTDQEKVRACANSAATWMMDKQ